MAAIGVLSAIAVYLAEAPIRNQDDWSDSLLGQHESGVESVVFDPTGRWLASVGADGSVYLWDMDSGDLAKVLQRALESTPTFSRTAWRFSEPTARVWPRETRTGPSRSGM